MVRLQIRGKDMLIVRATNSPPPNLSLSIYTSNNHKKYAIIYIIRVEFFAETPAKFCTWNFTTCWQNLQARTQWQWHRCVTIFNKVLCLKSFNVTSYHYYLRERWAAVHLIISNVFRDFYSIFSPSLLHNFGSIFNVTQCVPAAFKSRNKKPCWDVWLYVYYKLCFFSSAHKVGLCGVLTSMYLQKLLLQVSASQKLIATSAPSLSWLIVRNCKT